MCNNRNSFADWTAKTRQHLYGFSISFFERLHNLGLWVKQNTQEACVIHCLYNSNSGPYWSKKSMSGKERSTNKPLFYVTNVLPKKIDILYTSVTIFEQISFIRCDPQLWYPSRYILTISRVTVYLRAKCKPPYLLVTEVNMWNAYDGK